MSPRSGAIRSKLSNVHRVGRHPPRRHFSPSAPRPKQDVDLPHGVIMNEVQLDERFSDLSLAPELRWHCEPAKWSIRPADRILRISPDTNTDFWQRTHYGFEADTGHFLYVRTSGDFVVTTKVTTHPRNQYDQAGLMVRLSPACWMKTSVEFDPDSPIAWVQSLRTLSIRIGQLSLYQRPSILYGSGYRLLAPTVWSRVHSMAKHGSNSDWRISLSGRMVVTWHAVCTPAAQKQRGLKRIFIISPLLRFAHVKPCRNAGMVS